MPIPRNTVNGSLVAETAMTAVSWSTIWAGAFVILAVTLILTPLGAGLGVAWLSSWHHAVPSPRAFTAVNVIWIIIVQWVSAGLGGYLTGRMRTKWAGAHTHEVFFRDSVHGFLAWALATVISAILLLAATLHADVTGGLAGGAGITPLGSLLYSLSLFLGAFIASVAGALGGAHRDVHFETGRLWD